MISTKNFRKFRMENVVTEIPTVLDYMQEIYYRHPDGKLTLYVGRRDGTAQAVSEGQGEQGPTGEGVPAGGSFGAVLSKKTADDFDTEWTTEPYLTKVRFDTDPLIEPLIAGEMRWNPDERTLDMGVNGVATIQIGQETHYPLCRNTYVLEIKKGQAVMVNPLDISTGDHLNITLANANGSSPALLFLGVAYQNIPVGELGIVSWFGRVNDVIATDVKPLAETWLEGDILWANPTFPGMYTNVEPIAPNLRIPMAVVIQLTGSNLKMIIRPRLDENYSKLESAQIAITSNSGLFNTNNSTEYIIPFNEMTDDNSPSIIPNLTNKNIQITKAGLYQIDVCYSSYDLLSSSGAFLRISLRSSSSPITSSSGGNLVTRINLGNITTNINGEAFMRGSYVLSHPTDTSLYLAATMLHSNASGFGGTGYPVSGNLFGNIPLFRVTKLS